MAPIYKVEGHSVHSGKQSLSEGASERLIKNEIPSVSDRWVFIGIMIEYLQYIF